MVNPLKKVGSKLKKATKWDYENTLRKVKDTVNFEIDKTGRFSARFFQMSLALISYYWLAAQNAKFVVKYGFQGTINAMIVFAVVSPIISGFNVAVYLTRWIGKNWTSRRILSIETFCDLLMTTGWLAGFIALLAEVKTGCSLEQWTEGCVNFNWLVAWLFFLFVSWFAGLIFDIIAWRKGVCSPQEIDNEILLDIRRSARTTHK